MTQLRVLVVEDSATVRGRLLEVLEAQPDILVAGVAEDGQRAIELCQRLRPDVLSMDMVLPVMSGLTATEQIMAHCPTPILVVSSASNRGELFDSYDALAAGAVDVLEKPTGDEPDGEWERKFVASLKMVARIRVITHVRARLQSPLPPSTGPVTTSPPKRGAALVALGASTGGPGALVAVLRALPKTFEVPILLATHIGAPFSSALADWLEANVGRPVRYPTDGMPLDAFAGRVAMAPPGKHLIVEGNRLRFSYATERNSCRPSIDVLFESIARAQGPRSVACLLTGMGRDGASGLAEIRTAGGLTIAQDEASCVVYGMPREAVLLGAARHVLPLGEIGPFLAPLAALTPIASKP